MADSAPLNRIAPPAETKQSGPRLADPLITVVSVYHNRKYNARESVQSILAQTLTDFEFIIVDDGSTDGTTELLESIKDPRIRFVSKPNTGFTRSINHTISLARGRYIAVHGSSDISHPTRLQRQAEHLQRWPDVGVVGCFVRTMMGADEIVSAKPAGDDFYRRLKQDAIFTHGEVMYRRDLFRNVGGYRDFFKYSQDYDLWFRMSRHCRYAIIDEVLYTRHTPAGTVNISPGKILVQQLFAELARQAAREVRAGRRDPIEVHGTAAPFFLERSAMLGKRLSGKGLYALSVLDNPEGLRLIDFAFKRHNSARTTLYWCLSRLYGGAVFRQIIGPLYRHWRHRG